MNLISSGYNDALQSSMMTIGSLYHSLFCDENNQSRFKWLLYSVMRIINLISSGLYDAFHSSIMKIHF